ncbi:MAG: glycosyltransferase [Myxococcota bacterium]
MSDLPRLLFCCFDVVPGPSAISRRLTEYIKGLSERFQVVVLSAKTPDHPHIERYLGARLLRVPVGSGDLPSRSQTFDRAVRRQLESEEYGLVHFFDPFAGYALCERRGELGYRLIYDACTFPSVEIPLENPSLEANRRFVARVRRQELFCLMNADGVVVGSPLTANWVTGLGVERDRVRVLRAPVDLEPFKPEVMGRPDATPMKVLHLGRMTRGQGLETLLEALALALQTVDVRLTVVGPKHPEAMARLEAQVATLKLSGKVEFQDPVGHDDIFKVLATADVGALTLDEGERNQSIGTPLARLGEYLAAGRPVIAADLPSARALLPAEGVVLYRPGDARSLADALVQLAADKGRRVKLGAAARTAAVECDSARVRLELFKLYADVTGASVEAAAGDRPADPFEPTQLGSVPTDPGEVTQLRARTEDSGIGTNKVKTDPAIAARPDSSTDANAKAERPPVMGVLLREDVQVTEPGAKPASEPPVVMGAPLREEKDGPANAAAVAAALAEAVPAPIPGFDAPPPVAEPRVASLEAGVRTDLRAPAEVRAPAPTTTPDAVDSTAPASAPASATYVPPLAEPEAPRRKTGAHPLPRPSTPDTDPGAPAPSELETRPAEARAPRGTGAHELPGTGRASSVDSGPGGGTHSVSEKSARGTGSHATPEASPAVGSGGAPDSHPAWADASARQEPAPAGAESLKRPRDTSPDVPVARASGAHVGAHSPEASGAQAGARAQSASPPPASSSPSRKDTSPDTPAVSHEEVLPAAPAEPSPRRITGSHALQGATAPSGTPASSPGPLRASGSIPPAGADLSGGSAPSPSGLRPAAGPIPSASTAPQGAPTPSPSGLRSIPTASASPPGTPASSPSGLRAAPGPAPSPGSAPARAPRDEPSTIPMPPFPPPAARSASGEPARSATGNVPRFTPPAPPPLPGGPPPLPMAASSPTGPRAASPASPTAVATAPPSRPSSPPPPPAKGSPDPAEDEIAEIGADEVMDVVDDAPASSPADTGEEIMEADEAIQTVDTDPSPPPSALDPWLAQLVHGYCPPESHLFDRHTPPTTMPGRDT